MNIPDKIVGVAVKPVVVIIPALIRTEFFIGATSDGVAAIETFLFHSTKCLYKDTKNGFCKERFRGKKKVSLLRHPLKYQLISMIIISYPTTV